MTFNASREVSKIAKVWNSKIITFMKNLDIFLKSYKKTSLLMNFGGFSLLLVKRKNQNKTIRSIFKNLLIDILILLMYRNKRNVDQLFNLIIYYKYLHE